MIITLYREGRRRRIWHRPDVSEAEFRPMIGADFEAQRRENRTGEEAPRRRSPQEILDERINRLARSLLDKETRRHVSFPRLSLPKRSCGTGKRCFMESSLLPFLKRQHDLLLCFSLYRKYTPEILLNLLGQPDRSYSFSDCLRLICIKY